MRGRLRPRDGWVTILGNGGLPISGKGYGGAGNEFTSDIGAGPGGEIYIAGRGSNISVGTLTGPVFGGDDAFVAKLQSDLQPVWLRVFGGPGADQARDPTVGPDGALYVTGSVEGTANLGVGLSGSHGGRDAFLVFLAP